MNTIRHGLTNSLTRDVSGQTVAQILGNPGLQAALGFGSNVQARVNGRIAASHEVIPHGAIIDIETRANQKASDTVSFTLRYGPGNQLTREVPANTTIKSVLTNASFRAVLGYGDNVVAKINGALVRDDVYVSNGMTIDIETKANEKAV